MTEISSNITSWHRNILQYDDFPAPLRKTYFQSSDLFKYIESLLEQGSNFEYVSVQLPGVM